MNRIVAIALGIVLATASGEAAAYAQNTHETLSQLAAARSVLYSDPTLFTDWGYGSPSSESFPSVDFQPFSAQTMIGRGAFHEDDLTAIKRVFNHFYDP